MTQVDSSFHASIHELAFVFMVIALLMVFLGQIGLVQTWKNATAKLLTVAFVAAVLSTYAYFRAYGAG